MKRKRTYTIPPFELEGLDEKQIDTIRKQPNARILVDVFIEINRRLDNSIDITIPSMSKLLGHKKKSIRIAMYHLETRVFAEN